MSDEHEGFYRFRRKLAARYIALCLLLCALLAWKTIAAYRSSDAGARAVTAHSAMAMAAHVAELIDAVDQPLQSSAAAISAMGPSALTASAVKPLLAASSLASDSRFWLLFIDSGGRGVVASNGLRVGGVSFSDRPYFSEQVKSAPRAPYIGAPTIGRVSKRQVFFLSRRVESPDGKLLGMVAAPVVARRLADVFESARLEPSMSVVLATTDYKIIARAPLFEQSFGADLTPFIASTKTPFPASGSFAAVSPVQGDQRIFSYARVGKYPLVVAVGLGRRRRSPLSGMTLSLARSASPRS